VPEQRCLQTLIASWRDPVIHRFRPSYSGAFLCATNFPFGQQGGVAQALRILLFLTADENGWAPAEQLTRLSESAHIQ
jgi:hypothetical protein